MMNPNARQRLENRARGGVDALFNAETQDIDQLLRYVAQLEARTPELAAHRRASDRQLEILTRMARVMHPNSEAVREMVQAFDLEWGWPPEAVAEGWLLEERKVLLPRQGVFLLLPAPVPVPEPTPEVVSEVVPEAIPEPISEPVPEAEPLAAAPSIPSPVPAPENKGDRGRGRTEATVTREP